MFKRAVKGLALGATSILGTLFACGSPDSTFDPSAATNATVAIDLFNANGVKSGSCAGTLISEDTVLTAGHCVAGKFWFSVPKP